MTAIITHPALTKLQNATRNQVVAFAIGIHEAALEEIDPRNTDLIAEVEAALDELEIELSILSAPETI